MTFDEAQHPRVRTGRFTDKANSAPTASLADPDGAARDLKALPPTDIDGELAKLRMRRTRVEFDVITAEVSLSRYEEMIEREDLPARADHYRQEAERLRDQIEEGHAEVERLHDEEAPLNAEYRRRGRWPRAFLVTGGHVHSSMQCSTCNRDGKLTDFAWMTDYSGSTEDEIVEAAGERACTTCYPSAPAEALLSPSSMSTPEEDEQARKRADRDEAKARRAQEAEAKAITAPDGSELRLRYRNARTLVTAGRELVDALAFEEVDQVAPTPNREYVAENGQWRDMLVEAIAHKRGITGQQVLDEYRVKAKKKAAKQLREAGLA